MKGPRDQTGPLPVILRSDAHCLSQCAHSSQRQRNLFPTKLGICDKLCRAHRVIGHAVDI